MTAEPPYTLPSIRGCAGEVLVKVRAQPGATREGLVGVYGDALKVAVSASPERGKANAALERVIAEALGLRASSVRVVSGERSRDKWVALCGLDAVGAKARLSQALSNLARNRRGTCSDDRT